jgi:hypothetical protein
VALVTPVAAFERNLQGVALAHGDVLVIDNYERPTGVARSRLGTTAVIVGCEPST